MHVDELNGPAAGGAGRRLALRERGRERLGDPRQHVDERAGFADLVVGVGESEAHAELAKHFVIRPRLADGVDHRLHDLQVIRAVALRDVVVLEERRRGQDDVGVVRPCPS